MSTHSSTKSNRIASLDQFRGYCVVAMFIVNFLGGLSVTHHVLKHNNTHFSYADSIMPSFLFACGFSYRLSFLKRTRELGVAGTRWTIVWRSLGLILLSVMLTAFNSKIPAWTGLTSDQVARFIQELVKANLWEVLAIIGAVQILLLPLVATAVWVRVLAFLALGCAHVAMSWSFNYEFVYGRPNWMDAYLGAAGKRAWDGGCFGLLPWAQIMLLGTLAYDLVRNQSPQVSARWLVRLGLLLMFCGYGLSCLTRLYDVKAIDPPGSIEPSPIASAPDPVLPPWEKVQGRHWTSLLAEPPFVPPPPPSERAPNYWMMDKRIVTQSFVIFSGGMAVLVLGFFRSWCDVHQKGWGLFQTFGKNPLAAYIIHHIVAVAILAIVPKDSPLSWAMVGLIAFFAITWLFVKTLERRDLYLRL